jgi:hypothetical protein
VIERKFDIPDLDFNAAVGFEPGDKVRDRCWGGKYAGTVNRVDGDSVFVTWRGYFADYEMSPDQIRHDEEATQ